MKRATLFVLIACFWAGLSIWAASDNLLETSGFEENTYRWFQAETGDPYAALAWTDEIGFESDHALRVACSRIEPRIGKVYNSWTYEFFAHSVREQTVTLRFVVRTEGIPSTHGAYARIEAQQSTLYSRMLGWQTSRAISGSSDWTEVCVQFEIPSHAERVRIHLGLEGTGVAWFDNVRLTLEGVCDDTLGDCGAALPILFTPALSVPVLITDEVASPVEPKTVKPWTIAIYNAADSQGMNPLDYLAFELRSSESTNVVILEDQYLGPSKLWEVIGGAQIPQLICLKELGEVDTTSQATLSDFLEYCEVWFPSDHTLLLIYDHGGAWRGTAKDWSASSDGDTWLTPTRLSNALAAVDGVEALLYTAPCNMASIEATYEIAEYTKLIVASEETSGFVPWMSVLGKIGLLLEEYPEVSPPELGWYVLDYLDKKQSQALENRMIPAYAMYQFNALGMSGMSALVDAVDSFALALIDSLPTRQTEIVELRKAALSFREGELVDLGDFATQCLSLRELSECALAVIDALEVPVQGIVGNSEYAAAQGLNIYFPLFHRYLDTWQDYEQSNLRFLVDTRWEEFLRALYADPIH